MPQLKYRPFITQPHQGLTLGTDPLKTYEHMLDFNQPDPDYAKQPTWIYTPLANIPIPLSPTRDAQPQQRWQGADPELMRLPLMWLPKRLAYPYKFENSDIETPDEWAMRVFTEITNSSPIELAGKQWIRLHEYNNVPLQVPADLSTDEMPLLEYDLEPMRLLREATAMEIQHLTPLFDPDTGYWLDIPASFAGVNLDTEEGLSRMQAWLDGSPDPELDNIDIELMLSVPDRNPDWAEYAIHRPMIYLEHPEVEPRSLLEDMRYAGQFSLATSILDRINTLSPLDAETLQHLALVSQEHVIGMAPSDGTEHSQAVEEIACGALAGAEAEAALFDAMVFAGTILRPVTYRIEDWVTGGQRELFWELSTRHGITLSQKK